jgi:hypothetical protein
VAVWTWEDSPEATRVDAPAEGADRVRGAEGPAERPQDEPQPLLSIPQTPLINADVRGAGQSTDINQAWLQWHSNRTLNEERAFGSPAPRLGF